MKVRLREIRAAELEFLNSVRNQYNVSKSLNLFLPQSIEKEVDWLRYDRETQVHFLIECLDESLSRVGQVSLVNFAHRDKKAEFTVFLSEGSWGKGYGSISTKIMIHYGFTQLNLNKIYLHCYESNKNAKRMYESIGFLREGTIRDFIFKDGRYLNAFYYGMLRKEFDKQVWRELIKTPLEYDGLS